jgi:antitoxin (DNA-binding transcriptional repressor) of toxin-antitoxin stability system
MALSKPMHTVTLEEAQARLPELIAETENGAEIVITRDDKPVAKLAAAGFIPESAQTSPKRSLLGLLEGKITYHEGWEDTPEEFKPYME